MRRFISVFLVTQAEFDASHLYQRKLNIVTTLRRTHGVLLAVRETGRLFVAKNTTHQKAQESSLHRVDFSGPCEVTYECGERFPELKQAIANNLHDKSVRHFGRSLSLDDVQDRLYGTQLEIIS